MQLPSIISTATSPDADSCQGAFASGRGRACRRSRGGAEAVPGRVLSSSLGYDGVHLLHLIARPGPHSAVGKVAEEAVVGDHAAEASVLRL